jgi:hypothetical protein
VMKVERVVPERTVECIVANECDETQFDVCSCLCCVVKRRKLIITFVIKCMLFACVWYRQGRQEKGQ